MQRFTFLHDGSNQGWQTAYMAFHVAAQLGAPLLGLLVNPAADNDVFAQKATQIEVGGRAAGVAISTRSLSDFSVDVVAENAVGSNGLFVPRQLIQNGKRVESFLQALSCPVWIVSEESEIHQMAVLVNDAVADKGLIDHATTLSNRLQEPLFALVREEKPALDASLSQFPLPDFSPARITAALNQLGHNLLFLPVAQISLAYELPVNCVICPPKRRA